MKLWRLLAWILAAIAILPMFGLIDLITLFGWVNPAYEWPVPLEVSWGSLFTFLIAGSYVWIAIVPDRSRPAVIQLGIVATALAISSVAGLDGRPMWVAVPAAGSAVLFGWITSSSTSESVWPDGDRSWWMVRWPYLLLAGIGLFLWMPYALHALENSRNGTEGDITNGIEHWTVQGATGLALAVCAVVMAVWPPSVPLFRLTVSLSATLIGIAMLAYPNRAGAMDDPMWGIVMVIWGTAVALVPPHRMSLRARAARRTPASAPEATAGLFPKT